MDDESYCRCRLCAEVTDTDPCPRCAATTKGTSMYFSAGEYYLGDLCYVMAQWDDFVDHCVRAFDAVNWQDSVSLTYRGLPVWDAPTAYGDGQYTDRHGRTYGVDSGTIGLVPLALCDPDKLKALDGLGHIITFANGVTPQWEKGLFRLGHVTIDTRGEDEEA